VARLWDWLTYRPQPCNQACHGCDTVVFDPHPPLHHYLHGQRSYSTNCYPWPPAWGNTPIQYPGDPAEPTGAPAEPYSGMPASPRTTAPVAPVRHTAAPTGDPRGHAARTAHGETQANPGNGPVQARPRLLSAISDFLRPPVQVHVVIMPKEK
jgi:hypothetical protein